MIGVLLLGNVRSVSDERYWVTGGLTDGERSRQEKTGPLLGDARVGMPEVVKPDPSKSSWSSEQLLFQATL